MRTVLARMIGGAVGLAVLATGAGCGDDVGNADDDAGARVVVTTSILGDVVRNLVGDDADVEVVMPPGSDPHDFAPSARQAAAMRDADVLVINGLGFEEGLHDTIAAAEEDGATVIAAADAIAPLALESAHDEDADGEDEHAADEQGGDPHFFTDPARMAQVAARLGDELADHVDALGTAAHRDRVDAYVANLDALDAEVEGVLAAVPEERRLLVTNHDVFGYFAERYGFEVLGAVVPGGSTLAEPSAAGLEDLAEQIEQAQVPAIFAETSAPARLAEALAAEGTDVDVVELYSESLGEAGSDAATYLAMVRTNALRIADALT